MPSTVYLETSIISYLTGRATRNVVITAHQRLTRRWWATQRPQLELFVSPLVLPRGGGRESPYGSATAGNGAGAAGIGGDS
jgi:hypothetical protein